MPQASPEARSGRQPVTGVAFPRVIVGVLSADTSEAKGSGGKAKTLRVEIRHYESKSAV